MTVPYGMGGACRRFAASLMAAILVGSFPLWVVAGPPDAPPRLLAEPTRIPILLVMEPRNSEQTSAVEDVVPGPLLDRLEDAGYVPEESLFALRPASFEDVPGAATLVSAFVRQRVAASPQGQVDVVACGSSALVLRLALEAGLVPDGDVRNLIMVASPNRGTFVADLLKSAVELAKHESLLEKETRSWRYLPVAEELLARASTSPPPGSAAGSSKSNGWALPDSQAWGDETAWVGQRVREVYEPLYAKYVQERFLALPYVPAESPEETFAGWIRRTMPDFWDAAVSKALSPPLGPSSGEASANTGFFSTPSAGGDLTVAYYEILSMEVARNQYVMRLASKGSIIESLFRQPYVPKGWKDALLYYGTRVIQYYAGKALITLKSELQKVAVDSIVGWTGFLRDSSSPMLRRLIKEDFLVNLGTSSEKRFERLPANAYLANVNASSESRSASRKTRYVSIAAELANPWSLVWPELAPNDFLLEVDSSVAPVGQRDLIRVFRGLAWPSREGLLADARVQDYVLSLVAPGSQEGAHILPLQPGQPATMAVSSWTPSYAGLTAQNGLPLQSVKISLPDPPAGWQYRLWTEPRDSTDQPPSGVATFATGGAFAYTAGNAGILGLRLVRSGPVNPVSGTSVGSAYSAEVRVEAVLELLPGADEKTDSAMPGGGQDVSGNGDESQPAMPAVPESPDGSGPDLGYPLIRMVNRSKRTTHKEPKETYHEYWLLDFGDGTTQRIDANCDLTISHSFPKPGQFEVVAESYCGDRKLLRRTWSVVVKGPDDATRSFSCSSVARVVGSLDLGGPIMWVTGKPAVYAADFRIEAPDNVEVVSVKFDPGPKFAVVWERAGDFHVTCAATVTLRYLLEDATVSVENTYVRDVTVEVLTTGVTQ